MSNLINKQRNYLIFKILAMLAVVSIWGSPAWLRWDVLWNFDGTYHQQWYQAFYQTVISYREWPSFNPWMSAGEPLEGNANYGFFSIRAFLVLLLGPSVGIGMSILAYWLIGLLGAYKLSKIFWTNVNLRLLFSLLVVINSSFVAHLTLSHFPQQTIMLAPWIFYFYFQRNEDKWAGIKAGIFFSIGFNESLSYSMLYIFLIGSIFFLYDFIFSKNKNNKKNSALWLISFILLVATLCFYRAFAVIYVMDGWERIIDFSFTHNPITILLSLLHPFFYVDQQFWNGYGYSYCGNYSEIGMYLGPIAFYYIFSAYRSKPKHRLIYVLTPLLLFSVFNNQSFISITYWLSFLPGFSSHLCDNRISMITNFFISIIIIYGIKSSFENYSNSMGPKLLVVLFVCEQLFFTYKILDKTKNFQADIQEKDEIIGEEIIQIVANKKKNDLLIIDNISFIDVKKGFPFSYLTENNINIHGKKIFSNLPDFSENYFENSRVAYPFIQDNKDIKPIYWTPNSFLFKGLDPLKDVEIRFSRSKAWKINGEKIFQDSRIIENIGFFNVKPDSSGNLHLIYDFNPMEGKYYIFFMCIVLLFLNIFYIRFCLKFRSKKL